jgi:HEAT repeat protein
VISAARPSKRNSMIHAMMKHHELIEALAVPHKATSAYRTLLDLGTSAVPAVRAGLQHNNPDVRFHCCRFLDRYLSPETLSDLLGMLTDGDKRVRCSALHTLACDRCKEGDCRPEEHQVLPSAMKLLASDPDAHVRAMAIEVVGQFIHANLLASAAIATAVRVDPNSTVRKKAGWYAPGGPIRRRTKPKPKRQSQSVS